jgi:hypothetical protein
MAGTLVNAVTTKKEDYSDLLAIADYRNTPFTSMVNKSKAATNPRFDWTVDAYAAPSTAGVVDGVDVSDFADQFANRAKLFNYVQKVWRNPKVSGMTQDVSDMPGATNPIQSAVAKALVEIKRDVEATCLSSNDGQVDDGAVPYKTAGLGTWISTAGGTVVTIPAAYRPASAQIITTSTATLDEDTDLQGILSAIFNAVGGMGMNYTLLCGSVLRRRVTAMTRTASSATTNTQNKVRAFNQSAVSATVESSTTTFKGDFGDLNVVASSWIGLSGSTVDTDRGYVLDMDKVHLRYNERPTVNPLPDLGGGPRRSVTCTFGLQVDNPKGLGKFQP